MTDKTDEIYNACTGYDCRQSYKHKRGKRIDNSTTFHDII